MRKSISINAKNCCQAEKDRLVEELRKCDFSSESREEHRRCWQETSKVSGGRAKSCMVA